MAQGYYYGEPMPERDVLHLLRLIRKADRRMRRRGLARAREDAVIQSPAHAANGQASPEVRTGRPTGAPPRPSGANGHELPMPAVVAQRTPAPQRPAVRTGTPTQPVTRTASAEKTRPSRLRSAAANARARIAGLTGATAFEPARSKEDDGALLLNVMPPTPLRREAAANGKAQPRAARTEPITQGPVGTNGQHGANPRRRSRHSLESVGERDRAEPGPGVGRGRGRAAEEAHQAATGDNGDELGGSDGTEATAGLLHGVRGSTPRATRRGSRFPWVRGPLSRLATLGVERTDRPP
jgi:hypothetical protein